LLAARPKIVRSVLAMAAVPEAADRMCCNFKGASISLTRHLQH
jgi:hypothetical protein